MAALESHPEYVNSTSCVIAPSGEIIYFCTTMNPNAHFEHAKPAIGKWRGQYNKELIIPAGPSGSLSWA